MNHEKATISNQFHEVNYVAKKFGIDVWIVYKLKADLKTNNRKVIYDAIREDQNNLQVDNGYLSIKQ